MSQTAREDVKTEGTPSHPESPKEYEVHIRVTGDDPRTMLKDSADLAFRMELIPKPEINLLVNLYIDWGMNVLRKLWLDRMGYK